MTAHAITRSRLPDGRPMHLVTDLADRMVGETIRRTGGWEPAETALIQALVAPGDCAVDVGAHVGYFTVLLSTLVGCTGRVVAFEPEPCNFELLKANCILNGCANVALEARALGDRSGRADLYLAAANLGDHRLHATPGRSTRQVPVVRFDDYWAGGALDFLKLDAQGSEPAILDGGSRTIAANAGRLLCLMELSPGLCQAAGHDLGSVLAMLRSLQARVFAVGIAEPPRRLDNDGLAGLWQRLAAREQDDTNVSVLLAFSDAGCARLHAQLEAAASSGGSGWTFAPAPGNVRTHGAR